MGNWQSTARKDTITDIKPGRKKLTDGRVLDDRPEYDCSICGHTGIKNYPLEYLSMILGRTVYGHVTCNCLKKLMIKPKHKYRGAHGNWE